MVNDKHEGRSGKAAGGKEDEGERKRGKEFEVVDDCSGEEGVVEVRDGKIYDGHRLLRQQDRGTRSTICDHLMTSQTVRTTDTVRWASRPGVEDRQPASMTLAN